ncbi:MAG: hypothetical protein LLF80_01265 [Porphyromonadaceae bacterium]|nr:hypothetical protein [Porphyromonadaceae bacterium]
MKTKLLLCAALLSMAVLCFGQQNLPSDNWRWLMGEWKGEGTGNPGQGGGTFSFAYDLDKNIIVRKSHSEYPATNNKPKIIHDDLMVVYSNDSKSPSKAIYFDNEGHIINYAITYADKSITFTSIKLTNTPVFRLTYTLLENDLVNTKFEMSNDGVNFMVYIEGKGKKTN